MCLAIPMEVVEIKDGGGGLVPSPVAVVEARGIRQEVRLDIVDRFPAPGDYVIVHAGFAIHSLEAHEAEENLNLLRTMAEDIVDDQL